MVARIFRVGIVCRRVVCCGCLIVSLPVAAQPPSRIGSVAPDDETLVRSVGSSDIERQSDKKGSRKLLREGTQIRPTSGRFVASSGRWLFIPGTYASGRASGTDEASGGLNSPEGSTVGDATRPQKEVPQPLNGRDIGRDATNRSEAEGIATDAIPMIVVIENLMLSRVARAIQEDAEDDRWTVTGEVTEFGDENRLILRTIRRSERSD